MVIWCSKYVAGELFMCVTCITICSNVDSVHFVLRAAKVYEMLLYLHLTLEDMMIWFCHSHQVKHPMLGM